MSAVLHSEQTDRLRQVGLTALNGAMAIVCGLLAVMVAALAAGVLAISLSTATGWPRGGYDLSSGLGAAHVNPGAVKVMTGSDACTVAAGRRTCRHVTYTRTRPAPAGVTAERLVFAVAFIAILTPLVALSYGLGHAAACFTALARRRWFERRTITHLRNFALGGLVFLALWPVATRLALGIAVFGQALLTPGATVKAGFNLDLGPVPTLLTVVYATLLALITAVLAHARKVAEDHAQIV